MLFHLNFYNHKSANKSDVIVEKRERFDEQSETVHLKFEDYEMFDTIQITNMFIRDMISSYGFLFIKNKETNSVYYLQNEAGSLVLINEKCFSNPIASEGKLVGEFSLL